MGGINQGKFSSAIIELHDGESFVPSTYVHRFGNLVIVLFSLFHDSVIHV